MPGEFYFQTPLISGGITVTASAEPAHSVNATPPSIDAPIAEIATKATITPVMRPMIASVETVVDKNFVWPEDVN